MKRNNKSIEIASVNTKNDAWVNTLQQDNVFPNTEIVDLSSLTGIKSKQYLSKAIVCEGEIVNTVSPSYGFLKNENFFLEVERALVEADIKYVTRSINRDNENFAVDYILNDPSYSIKVKNGKDTLLPMLRFNNSYTGGSTGANFGAFRKICNNGLHIAETKLGFKLRHTPKLTDIIIPNINEMVAMFMDNEFYSLHKNFQVLSETLIEDMSDFVRYTATEMDLFKYEMSEKNPDTPSKNAQLVIDIMEREAKQIGTQPNLWLGYNAFNEVIHAARQPFAKQKKQDTELFNIVMDYANN